MKRSLLLVAMSTVLMFVCATSAYATVSVTRLEVVNDVMTRVWFSAPSAEDLSDWAIFSFCEDDSVVASLVVKIKDDNKKRSSEGDMKGYYFLLKPDSSTLADWRSGKTSAKLTVVGKGSGSSTAVIPILDVYAFDSVMPVVPWTMNPAPLTPGSVVGLFTRWGFISGSTTGTHNYYAKHEWDQEHMIPPSYFVDCDDGTFKHRSTDSGVLFVAWTRPDFTIKPETPPGTVINYSVFGQADMETVVNNNKGTIQLLVVDP
jgi:hypothetical protein